MSARILVGDCRERLRDLPDRSVHTVVTSPPYFGLRDYGTGSWAGGDPDCQHRVGGQVQDNKAKGAITAGVRPGVDASRCLDCGASRVDCQIGLEPTPDEFVAAMVGVFREVRRVLRDDGTVWLNIGDSYNAAGRSGHGTRNGVKQGTNRASATGADRCRPNVDDLKEKDLIGIPWMLAFALRADGWYLRQDIVWSKPNPMPESVEDRCTKAHEYLFLLSKKPRYFYDAVAIAEPLSENPVTRSRNDRSDKGIVGALALHGTGLGQSGNGGFERSTVEQRNKRDVWTVGSEPFDLEFCAACQRSYDQTEYRALKRRKVDERTIVTCRCGVEDKWLSHFATFPASLILDCIRAGCPARCCEACGAPEVRVVTKGEPDERHRVACGADSSGSYAGVGKDDPSGKAQNPSDLKRRILEGMRRKSSSFVRTCDHDAPMVPGTVLDPFGGAGTTGLVAEREHRDSILLELNPHYAEMTRQRLIRDGGMLTRVEVIS